MQLGIILVDVSLDRSLTLASQHDGRKGRVSLRTRLFQDDFEDSFSDTILKSESLRSDS